MAAVPDDTIDLMRSQEYHSCSSDVESFSAAADSYKNRRRQRNNPNMTTEGPSEVKRPPSKRTTNYGTVRLEPDERQPLLRERKMTQLSNQDGELSTDQEGFVVVIDNNTPTEKPQPSKTRRFLSLFVVFLLPFVTGLALIVGMNVNSDTKALEIRPEVGHYYITVLIVVFILWLVIQKWREWKKQGDENAESFEPLIPSHLLNGLVLFGMSSSAFQILTILDVSKCSESISGLDMSYTVSPVMHMLFVYFQVYVFYTLSRKRRQKMWFSHEFTMFTLAVNLTLWAWYFCASAVSHPDLKNVGWLRRYHYGLEEDSCSGPNNTGNMSRKLHDLANHMAQYNYTFSMEYSLLASALLLHIWLELATPAAGKFEGTSVKWVVWRFGFILGLFTLPLIGCIAVYSTVNWTKDSVNHSAILSALKLVLFASIFICCCIGLCCIKRHYKRDMKAKALKVDLILLFFSAAGFVVLDFFTIFATIVEKEGKYISFGITAFGELAMVAVLTIFIIASYFYKVRPTAAGVKAARNIRQISSFCLIVSFGFWAMRSYTFRSDYHFDYVGWHYFKTTTWFAITQFATPLCIFYHFHCAVCLSAIIAGAT